MPCEVNINGETYVKKENVLENKIGEQVETINGLVSLLLEKSEELEPEFVKTVDKHFWDLA